MLLGTTLGRLSLPVDNRLQAFPINSWRDEFEIAQEANLEFIEWIFDIESAANNPLSTDAGIEDMLQLADQSEVPVLSVCADNLLELSFLDPDTLSQIHWLIGQAHKARLVHIVLPFFKASAIEDEDDFLKTIDVLKLCLNEAEQYEIELHLEMGLLCEKFRDLLTIINHSLLRVTYDSGNSTLFGYDPTDELPVLGSWLGSVHIKDHIKNGPSVLLGTGDTNFPVCFRLLAEAKFNGPFVLQGARGEPGSEKELAQQYRQFVEDHWQRAYK